MVGRLRLGVVALEFGVVGRLARDPERRRGNRCGETVRFSEKFSQPMQTSASRNFKCKKTNKNEELLARIHETNISLRRKVQMHKPSSLFGVPLVNKKIPVCSKGREVGDGESSFLHSMKKYYSHDLGNWQVHCRTIIMAMDPRFSCPNVLSSA